MFQPSRAILREYWYILWAVTCQLSNWYVDCVWNVMAHAQKPDFVFRRNGRVHLNRRGREFSRLLAAEECASAVVMLDTPCSEVVWRVLATHSIRQFPFHFPSCASPCAITFRKQYTSHDDQYTLSPIFPLLFEGYSWRFISAIRLTIPIYTIRFIAIGTYVRALYAHQYKFSPVHPPPLLERVSREYSFPLPQDALVIPAIRMAMKG